MSLWTRIAQPIDAMNRGIGRIVGWLVLAMVTVGAFNALARYAGRFMDAQLSSNAYIELQWYLFSMLFLLGAGHTLQKDQHVRVDVLYGRLTQRGKAWIDLVGGVFFLIPFCLFGLFVSFPSVRNSWAVLEVSPDPGGLPRYPIKTMILLCFALLLVQGISEIAKRIDLLSSHGGDNGR